MRATRRKVYFKWFLSYIIILLIPIATGIGVYYQSYQITKKQADTLNENLMQMVKKDMDNHINEINKTLSRLALDYNVQTLSTVKGKFTSEDQFLIYKLVSDLNNIQLAENFIQDIFVYFNQTQSISSLNGNMSAELYYDIYRKNDIFEFEQFKNYMGKSHYLDLLITKKKDGTETLTFTMTNIRSELREDAATIGIVINSSFIENLIESIKWDDRIKILILNSRNEVINSTEKQSFDMKMKYEDGRDGKNYRMDVMGEPCIVSSVFSDKTDWKYIMITPVKLLEKNARQVQTISVIGLFLCVIIGFLLSYLMTKRNYNPLQGILELFKGEGRLDSLEGENEYQWIKAQAEEFFLEHSNTKRTLLHNKKILDNYYIFKLLEYPYDAQSMEADEPSGRISLHAPYNIVVLFEVRAQADDENESETQEQKMRLYKFIIRNIFEETISNHFNSESTEIGDKAAFIINMPDIDKSMIEVIRDNIDNLQQIAAEQFHFGLIALVGDVHEGMEGIHSSYLEAKEAEEYITLLDTDIIFYDEIKNTNQKYYYPMEIEQKIINALKAGEQAAAAECINQVFDINCGEKQISADLYRCLLFDMMGTIMKGSDAIGFNEFPEDFDISKQISVKIPFDEMKERFKYIVDMLCEYIWKMQKENDSQLSIKVKAYIQENYTDPDLNISQTGFHFNMTPAYISSLFKKQTGESLLDYINQIRIQEASRLLKDGYSVVDTAQKVGFRGSGAFIRVFKKITGVTPGQMKRGV